MYKVKDLIKELSELTDDQKEMEVIAFDDLYDLFVVYINSVVYDPIKKRIELQERHDK